MEWLDLTAFHAFDALNLLTAQPNESVKLGQLPDGAYRRLGPPVRLFDFDWVDAALATMGEGRQSAPLPLRIEHAGQLTTLVVYFTLDLDGCPANIISTAPESPNVAWDQAARHLPVPLRVTPGDDLTLRGRHTDCYLQTLTIGGFKANMLGDAKRYVSTAMLVNNPNSSNLTVALEAPNR